MAAIGQPPQGAELLVARYFNADMVAPDGQERNEIITSAMATEGLENMVLYIE